MKMKFQDLPSPIQEHLLWEMDLDYDPYESCKAEAVHDCMNGYITTTNERIIASYCKALSDETLLSIMNSLVDRMQEKLLEMEELKKVLTF